MRFDIKRILDLGTGIGAAAAVTALALEDKGVKDYEIHTIENTDWVRETAEKLIPEDLRKNITFHKSESIIWFDKNTKYQPYSTYKDIPEGEWDLIIHDGPGPFLEDDQYLDFPNGTITRMLHEGGLKPGTLIAWDKRRAALELLERYYGSNFKIKEIGHQVGFVLLKYGGGAIFEDMIRRDEERNGYFDTPEQQAIKLRRISTGLLDSQINPNETKKES